MVPADSDRIPRAPPYSGATFNLSQLPVRDCHPLRPLFPKRSGFPINLCWFRLCPFRSPLLRVSTFLSFPPGTKMFQFPGFAPTHVGSRSSTYWVAPFRDARINSCLQIPEPFRSLPRLSSPPDSLGILRSLLSSFSCDNPSRNPSTTLGMTEGLSVNQIVVRKFRLITSLSD